MKEDILNMCTIGILSFKYKRHKKHTNQWCCTSNDNKIIISLFLLLKL